MGFDIAKTRRFVNQSIIKFYHRPAPYQGATKPVPKRQRNPVVTILIGRRNGVMQLVLIGRDENPLKPAAIG